MTTATCTASVYMVRMCINALQNRCGGQCDWMGMVLCKGFPKWKKGLVSLLSIVSMVISH